MSPTPHIYKPLLLKSLVLALLLTSGVQAWQIFQPPTAAVQPVYLLSAPAPEPPPEPAPPTPELPPANETPAAPAPPPQPPQPVVDVQAPKYLLGRDFNWEMQVSSTPGAYTPWTGNGPPFLIIYYQGLHDTAMVHNGYATLRSLVGFTVCSDRTVRYTDFVGVDAAPALDRMLYQSNPKPPNPLNLLGTGENCYLRAGVLNEWDAGVCMEGDGQITLPWEEPLPDNRTVLHADHMDYCLLVSGRFPGQ